MQPLYKKINLCNRAKYIAALVIVNGHLFLFGSDYKEMAQFLNLGACCVTFFFFISAYGLLTSYQNKSNDYLKSFCKKRIIKLIVPLITAYLFTLPIYNLLIGPIDWQKVFLTILWGGPYLQYSWYVSEIIIVYLLFFLVTKWKGTSSNHVVYLSFSILLLMAILIFTKQPLWYIVSLPGFIIGLWYQKYEITIITFFKGKHHYIYLFILPLLWIIFWQWSSTGGLLLYQYRYEYIAKYLSNIFFITFVIPLLLKLKGFNSTPPNFYITNSFYEVYLIQNCCMILASYYKLDFSIYWFLTMCLVVAIGYVLYFFNTLISSKISISSLYRNL